MTLFSYLAQVVGWRVFIGQKQHQAGDFWGRETHTSPE